MQSLDDLLGIDRRVTIRRFIGDPFPNSRAQAQRVVASNGKEYVAKTNRVESGVVLPFVAQEFLCGLLGQRVNLPMPDFRLLHHKSEVWFGSEKKTLASDHFQSEILARVPNRHAVHMIAAFDVWVHNHDRHQGNVAIATKGHELELLAYDHTHCPLFGQMQCVQLSEHRETPAADVIQPFFRSVLTERRLLLQAIDRIEEVDDLYVRQAVEAAPGEMWTVDDRQTIADFLIYRKAGLHSFFQRSRDVFNHLEGGPV